MKKILLGLIIIASTPLVGAERALQPKKPSLGHLIKRACTKTGDRNLGEKLKAIANANFNDQQKTDIAVFKFLNSTCNVRETSEQTIQDFQKRLKSKSFQDLVEFASLPLEEKMRIIDKEKADRELAAQQKAEAQRLERERIAKQQAETDQERARQEQLQRDREEKAAANQKAIEAQLERDKQERERATEAAKRREEKRKENKKRQEEQAAADEAKRQEELAAVRAKRAEREKEKQEEKQTKQAAKAVGAQAAAAGAASDNTGQRFIGQRNKLLVDHTMDAGQIVAVAVYPRETNRPEDRPIYNIIDTFKNLFSGITEADQKALIAAYSSASNEVYTMEFCPAHGCKHDHTTLANTGENIPFNGPKLGLLVRAYVQEIGKETRAAHVLQALSYPDWNCIHDHPILLQCLIAMQNLTSNTQYLETEGHIVAGAYHFCPCHGYSADRHDIHPLKKRSSEATASLIQSLDELITWIITQSKEHVKIPFKRRAPRDTVIEENQQAYESLITTLQRYTNETEHPNREFMVHIIETYKGMAPYTWNCITL